MMTATDTRKEARNHLQNKWGKGALITFCYFLIEMIIGFIVTETEDINIIGLIVSIAQLLISVPISYGLVVSFIKLKRDEEVGAFDFLKNGFNSFKKAWTISLRIVLKLILPIILMIVAFVMISVSFVMGMNGVLDRVQEVNRYNYEVEDSLGFYEDITYTKNNDSSKASICMVLGVILLFVSAIYAYTVSLKYVQSFYIYYDEPDLSSKEIVEKSATMMKKNRGNYFVLILSFIGWAILAILSLGIGMFWLVPYINVSQVCFYEALKAKNENPIEQ